MLCTDLFVVNIVVNAETTPMFSEKGVARKFSCCLSISNLMKKFINIRDVSLNNEIHWLPRFLGRANKSDMYSIPPDPSIDLQFEGAWLARLVWAMVCFS